MSLILKTKEENGITYTKWEEYVPPVFPVRDYIIESLDGISVLVTPGQTTTYTKDGYGIMVRLDAPGKKKATVSLVKYEGYRPLRDRMHATRMTQDEAIAFAKEQAFVLAETCRPGAKATHQLIAE